MKQRAAELRAEGKKGAKKADGLQDMRGCRSPRRLPTTALAERVRVAVTTTAPGLSPKTWYGMPAYANDDGKVVLFFQDSGKFKYRYSTLGFQTRRTAPRGRRVGDVARGYGSRPAVRRRRSLRRRRRRCARAWRRTALSPVAVAEHARARQAARSPRGSTPSQAVPRPVNRPSEALISLRAWAPTKIAGIPVRKPRQTSAKKPSQNASVARLRPAPRRGGPTGTGQAWASGLVGRRGGAMQ